MPGKIKIKNKTRIGIALGSVALLAAILFSVLGIYYYSDNRSSKIEAAQQATKYSKYDRMDLAMQQEWEMTHDPATGEVPRERLQFAHQQADRTKYSRSAIPNVNWRERGPSNVAGRTRAMIFDPNDPSGTAVFAGSVGGGLWKTTNIFAQRPDWEPIDDLMPNLAVTTITYDPNNTTTMYFGTGEGWYNGDAIRGDGIWKSTDGGVTWSQLAATTVHQFSYVQKLVIDSVGNMLAATHSNYCNTGGIFRSTDGGSTWTRTLSGNGPACGGSQYERAADVEVAQNGDIYASMGIFYSDGLYKSTDNGATWTQITGGGFPNSGYERVEIACAPNDSNTVIAVLQDASSNDCYGIYLSDDAGSTWTSMTVPTGWNFGGADFTRGQAWYDLIVAFDPNNKNRIFLGGIDLHLSEDGGSTWTQISQWYGGGGYQYIHADQHGIYFKPNSSDTVLFGNDGGVYLSTDASNTSPTIEFKNDNYNVTQYYAAAIHPTAGKNYFLAGAQDNGSHRFNNVGPETTVEVTGGDGAFCAIDQDDVEYQFTSYVYNQYRRSTDSGYSFINVDFNGNAGKFINPWDFDDNQNHLYASYVSGEYLLWENAHTSTTSYNISAGFSSQVSAVTCDPHVTNKVWFGTDDGSVYAVTDAHTFTPTVNDVTGSSFPSSPAYVSCIAVSPTDQNHVVVTFSNYGVNSVWETTDGGSSWNSIENNLPDMPVRWALFNPNNDDEIMLATEVGVWSTDNINGSSTDWAATNTGLANVRTDMLQYRDSDNLVIAATHGRGLYSTDAFTTLAADFGTEQRVAYIGESIQFYDNSYQATGWSWNFGDGNSSTAQDPTHSYSAAGTYDITLEINGGPTSETKTGFIKVLPNRSTPYTWNDGGNFDVNTDDFGANNIEGSGFALGNSSQSGKNGIITSPNAWVLAINQADYKNNTIAALRTPQFDFSASGTYTLSFYTKYNTESNFDGFRVEYSTDQGTSWHVLGSLSSPYNTESASSAFISDPFLAGVASSWSIISIDASSLSGNANVGFRFIFRSDGYVVYPGLVIENFEIEAPVNLLPLEDLLVFDARGKTDFAEITWTLDNEQRYESMSLQRSMDGKRFEEIAKIYPQGKSDYKKKDYDIQSDIHYYRLRLNEKNGSFFYSNIEAVKFQQGLSLTVSPNPVSNLLKHSLATEKEYILTIHDASGRNVLRRNGIERQVSVDVSNWRPGVYFSTIESEQGQTQTVRWVKY